MSLPVASSSNLELCECCPCYLLQDMVPQLVMSQEPKEIKLVKDLVIRLAEEQEVLWIEEIIGVLVNRGEWVQVW